MDRGGGQQHDRRGLHERHQRDRREVQHQARQRGLAEGVGGHRPDRALGRDRRAGEQRPFPGEPGRRPRQAEAGSRATSHRAHGSACDRIADRGEHRQPEADVDHGERRRHDDQRDRDGDGVDRRRAQVERARRQIDRRRQRRAGDRGAADDGGGIQREHAEHDDRARPRRQADAADDREHDRGEHGDVAARDRQHVVGAGPLHARFDRRATGPARSPMRTASTIAVALRIVGPIAAAIGPAGPRPRRGRGLGERRSARQHLDQRRALDGAEHAGAAPREPQFLVRRAEVAVRQRAPQRRGHAHESPCPPRVSSRRCADAGDRRADAAGHRHPVAAAPDASHVDAAGDAEVRRHGVVAQHAVEDDRIVAGQRRQLRGEGRPGRRGTQDEPDGRAEQARRDDDRAGPCGATRSTRPSPRPAVTRRRSPSRVRPPA